MSILRVERAVSDLYTLETLSHRLGGIPISTLKHRINQLGIPAAARGSRNKLLFDERAAALLEASDQLIKEGNGITTTRRLLKLEQMGDGGELALVDLPVASAEARVPLYKSPMAEADFGPEGTDVSLARLSQTLAHALAQLEAKDQQLDQLNEELRRALEASATFQQKTFYLQSELQRLQGELKEARRPLTKDHAPWQKFFKKDP